MYKCVKFTIWPLYSGVISGLNCSRIIFPISACPPGLMNKLIGLKQNLMVFGDESSSFNEVNLVIENFVEILS